MTTRFVFAFACLFAGVMAVPGPADPADPLVPAAPAEPVISWRSPLQHQYAHTYSCTTDRPGQRGTILLPQPNSESWQRVVSAATDEPAVRFVSDLYKQPYWGQVDARAINGLLTLSAKATVICSDLQIDEVKARNIPWPTNAADLTRYPVVRLDSNLYAGIRARVSQWKQSALGPYTSLQRAYTVTRNDLALRDSQHKLEVMFTYAREMGLIARAVEIVRLASDKSGVSASKTIGEVEVPGIGWIPFDPSASPSASKYDLTFGGFRSSRWIRVYAGKTHDAGKQKASFINGYWGNVALGGNVKQAIDLRYTQPPVIPWTDPELDNRPIAVLLVLFSDSAPAPYSRAEVEALVLGPRVPNFADYLKTSTYGRLTLDGSAVLGPIRLDTPATAYYRAPGKDYDSAQNSKLQDHAIQAAGKSYDLSRYKSIVVVYPNVSTNLVPNAADIGVQGGGRYVSEEGEVVVDGVVKTSRATVAAGRSLVYFPINVPLSILVHEVGHSFGLDHSWDEEKRQNPFDGMGLQSPTYDAATYNAWHRIQLGVLKATEIAEIRPGEKKEVTLNALNTTTETVKAVRVWRANMREFTLIEFRTRGRTYDRQLPQTGVFIYEVSPGRGGPPSNAGAAYVDRVSALIQHPAAGPYQSWPVNSEYTSPNVVVRNVSQGVSRCTLSITNKDRPMEPSPR